MDDTEKAHKFALKRLTEQLKLDEKEATEEMEEKNKE
jgi:hypothetical protein